MFIALTVFAAVCAPANAHQANAVTTWNANAGEAAIVACLAPTNNPLHESRMYAMTHLAIHDALNAIKHRSRPYAFDATAKRRTSPDAAVAAAARDVLVALLNQLPEPFPDAASPRRSPASKPTTRRPSRDIPDGPAKTRGIELGRAAAAAILALRAADGANTTTLFDSAYPQGTAPGEYRFTPGLRFCVRPGMGRGHPIRVARQLSVQPGSALRRDPEEVHRRFQRGQVPRW